jgi:segregation and condensation protein B
MSLKSKIEATLFVTGKAMKINEIAEIVKAAPEDIEESLLDLIMDYSSREGALEIDDEDGYIIQVKSDYSDIVETLMPIAIPENILKTLCAIAIKQPVAQSDIVTLRGATAYDHVNYLLAEELISKKSKGKSYVLKTTQKFQEYFKITGDTKELARILETGSRN